MSQNLRLDSWKEIAQYLGRAQSTVRRWEEEKRLPIHRVPGGARQAVFAFTEEIDRWLVETGEEAGTAAPSRSAANVLKMPVSGSAVPLPAPRPDADREPLLLRSLPAAAPAPAQPPTRRRPIWAVFAAAVALTLTVIVSGWLARPLPAPTVLRYTQLTNDGQPKAPPLVTDGVRLYFNEGTSEASVISQVPLNGGRPSPVPGSVGLEIRDISPDGAELVVKTASPGATTRSESPLWLLPLTGGSPRSLGVSARAAACSPNGERIAYAQGAFLYTIRVDGRDSRKLAGLPGVSWIRWSPDGTRLSLTVDEPNGVALWQISSDGTGLARVLPESNPGQGWTQSWTPDGRYLLFCRRVNATTDLWALSQKPGIWRKPDRRVFSLTSGPLDVFSPITTRASRQLFAMGRLPRGELLRQDSKSGQFLPWLGVSADGVTFSPDGKWVAYSLWPGRTLWRSRIDGGDRLQLTSPSLEALVPRWSPDGRDIAFMARVRGEQGRWNIYRLPAGGGKPEPLLPAGENRASPSWSPTGHLLAFAGATWMNGFSKDPTVVQVFDLGTRQVSKVPGSEGLWAPKWSPDERHLVAERTDSEEIMLHDFRTGQWESFAKIGGQDIIGYVCWSHAGDYVYFNTSGKSGLSIYRVGLKDREMALIANLKDVHLTESVGEWFGLAPDDSPLVLRDTSIQEIYAMDVDFP